MKPAVTLHVPVSQWWRPGRRYRTVDSEEVPRAAGVLISSLDANLRQSFLLLRRARGDFHGHWAFPGGGIEQEETPLMGAWREACEEIDAARFLKGRSSLAYWEALPISDGFQCYRAGVFGEFDPTLNEEHDDFIWTTYDQLPEPMHPNAKAILDYLHKPY